jgi:transposase InsO family protein
MIELVADVFNKRMANATNSPRETTHKSKMKKKTDDESEEEIRAVAELRALGLRASLAAAVVGHGASTVRRWRMRKHRGDVVVKPRGPRGGEMPSEHVVDQVDRLVRALHGLIGADAISHTVDGVSRRKALAIKKATVTQMERERIARCERVRISAPGIVRGMDAMYEMTDEGWRWLLLFGDAAVPYRTSALVANAYDGDHVERAIDADFEQHGAPIVLRIDRASAHRTPGVRRVLARHHVLLLHGPPRHPGFYGQQERQNRDNRAWLRSLDVAKPGALPERVERMRHALNELWPRRTLGFRTAGERWREKPVLDVDRQELQLEVDGYERDYRQREISEDLAQRLAIEKALTNHGWLRREAGGWC